GEPTLRSDLEELVAAVVRSIRLKYVTLITHGAMLTSERARSLWQAGVNQLNISLDYLDERHDHARGIPGLSTKLFATLPRLRDVGVDNVRFNTVIRNDNLDQVLPIVRRAESLGFGVNFSLYTDAKNGNRAFVIGDDRVSQLDEVVRDLLAFKKRKRGVI